MGVIAQDLLDDGGNARLASRVFAILHRGHKGTVLRDVGVLWVVEGNRGVETQCAARRLQIRGVEPADAKSVLPSAILAADQRRLGRHRHCRHIQIGESIGRRDAVEQITKIEPSGNREVVARHGDLAFKRDGVARIGGNLAAGFFDADGRGQTLVGVLHIGGVDIAANGHIRHLLLPAAAWLCGGRNGFCDNAGRPNWNVANIGTATAKGEGLRKARAIAAISGHFVNRVRRRGGQDVASRSSALVDLFDDLKLGGLCFNRQIHKDAGHFWRVGEGRVALLLRIWEGI